MKLRRTTERPVVNGRAYIVALDEGGRGWLCTTNSDEMLVAIFGPVDPKQKKFDIRNTSNFAYIEATLNAMRRRS